MLFLTGYDPILRRPLSQARQLVMDEASTHLASILRGGEEGHNPSSATHLLG